MVNLAAITTTGRRYAVNADRQRFLPSDRTRAQCARGPVSDRSFTSVLSWTGAYLRLIDIKAEALTHGLQLFPRLFDDPNGSRPSVSRDRSLALLPVPRSPHSELLQVGEQRWSFLRRHEPTIDDKTV